MPGTRRGLVAPQNTFLENIIRRSNGQRKYFLPLFILTVYFQDGIICQFKKLLKLNLQLKCLLYVYKLTEASPCA